VLASFPEIKHLLGNFPLNLIQKHWAFYQLFIPEFDKNRILGHLPAS